MPDITHTISDIEEKLRKLRPFGDLPDEYLEALEQMNATLDRLITQASERDVKRAVELDHQMPVSKQLKLQKDAKP
jgi:hypothetical protein